MDEDEDPEIAAALAKLAEQDAAGADDARSALEWIAGEQGLTFLTQERIQSFCWYQLPVKWLIDLDDKLRVVAALDLLQLPGYAAICRSRTTREILTADETAAPANHPLALTSALARHCRRGWDLPGWDRQDVPRDVMKSFVLLACWPAVIT